MPSLLEFAKHPAVLTGAIVALGGLIALRVSRAKLPQQVSVVSVGYTVLWIGIVSNSET